MMTNETRIRLSALFALTLSAGGSSRLRDTTEWVSTSNFPIGLPHAYTVDPPACVKQRLPALAGAGKGLARLTCP